MWQGRAEGIQQQLDQAAPWQNRVEGLLNQLDGATVRAEGLQQQFDQAMLQLKADGEAGKEGAATVALQEARIRRVSGCGLLIMYLLLAPKWSSCKHLCKNPLHFHVHTSRGSC